jgi:hypothetical protein
LISLSIIPAAAFAYFQERERFRKKPYKVVRFGDPEPAPLGSAKPDAEDGETEDAATAALPEKDDGPSASGKKRKKVR